MRQANWTWGETKRKKKIRERDSHAVEIPRTRPTECCCHKHDRKPALATCNGCRHQQVHRTRRDEKDLGSRLCTFISMFLSSDLHW